MHACVLQKTDQIITCSCILKDRNLEFLCSAVYEQNSQDARRRLWAELEDIRGADIPWIVASDFNCMRFTHEKIGGDVLDFPAMEEFNNCLMETELSDLKWWGHKFTWWNKQTGLGKIECKSDKVLVNGPWLSSFPLSKANFLLPSVSDHSPSITTVGSSQRGKPKPFKFFDMCITHPNFLKVVKDVWDVPVDGNPIFRVAQKLKATKILLKQWNRSVFGCIDTQLKNARNEMYKIQEARRVN